MSLADQEKVNIRSRILCLCEESCDPQFGQYLTKLLDDLDTGRAEPSRVAAEAERAYSMYCEKMGITASEDKVTATETAADTITAAKAMPAAATADSLPTITPAAVIPPAKDKSSPGNAEYAIGAIVLCVLGSLFLLSAFITFGVYVLEGLWQGLFLYLVSFALIALSEFLVKKWIPKFAHAITGLGIGALYASTVINYSYLETFNSIVSLSVTIAITGFAIWLGKRQDSIVFRLVSIFGGYVSFLLIAGYQSNSDYLIAIAMIMIVNAVGIFLAEQKYQTAIECTLLCVNTVFIITFSLIARRFGIFLPFIIWGMILNLAFICLIRWRQEKTKVTMILFAVCLGVLGGFILALSDSLFDYPAVLVPTIDSFLTVFSPFVLVGAVAYWLNKDNASRTILYCFMMIFTMIWTLLTPLETIQSVAYLVLFIISLCFKRFEHEGIRLIMTIIIGSGLLTIFVLPEPFGTWMGWAYFAVLLVQIPLIRRWRLVYQYATTWFVVLFVAAKMTAIHHKDWFRHYELPVAAAVLLLLIPVFHYLVARKLAEQEGKKARGMSKAYNISVMIAILIVSLMAVQSLSQWAITLTALVGAVAIIVILSETYFLAFAKKYLLLAIYLPFMMLFVRFPSPIIINTILMVIAMVSVAAGFRFRDKSLRICGLTLTIFVCAKIAIYDYRFALQVERMIVFMVVGAIALFISLLYIYVEKKSTQGKEELSAAADLPETNEATEENGLPLMEISPETEELSRGEEADSKQL
ncbi:MAG: DUF2339 domain-containing protein [Lachnospiraceae bacterium]|jgi:hypothetical protein|nr:DUF2339 domain-containing protein [Lachnospiraceae bacterium]